MSNYRVLVVDDEASNRTLVKLALSRAGYTVVAAADGPEALRLVKRRGPFDLFVRDVVMPQMHGDELARQLRQDHPDARILYLTVYTDKLFQNRHVLWEHEALVEKPVSIDGLLKAVSRMLTGRCERLKRTA